MPPKYYANKNKRRRANPAKKKKARKNKRRTSARPKLRVAVKSILRDTAERKFIGYYSGAVEVGNCNSVGTFQFIQPVGPFLNNMYITQGTNVSQRIGNKIRTKNLNLRLIVKPNKYEAAVNDTPVPFYLIVYFGYAKDLPKDTNLATFNEFYTKGNADFPPTGTLLDTWHHENKDKWVIKKKDIIKVGTQNIHASSPMPTGQQNFANNDFKIVQRRNYNLTDIFPTNLTYNDNEGEPSNTTQLFWWVEAVDITGTRNNGHLAEFWYETRYEYTDV